MFVSYIHLACVLLMLTAAAQSDIKNANYIDKESPVEDRPLNLETMKYLLLSKLAKYHSNNNNNNEWKLQLDPSALDDPVLLLDMLNEMEYNNIDENGVQGKPENFYLKKRPSSSSHFIGDTGGSGSLSIVNSLDVLRNRLLLEIARKKVKEGADRNRVLFNSIGKRGPMMKKFWQTVDSS